MVLWATDCAEHILPNFEEKYRKTTYPATTCATLLLSRDVHPKFVQELLGHSSIALTLDRYSHWIPSMGDQTATAMEAVLS